MSDQLLQHIYTSTARMNFETVAVSPGVSGEVLKQLEARAQSYPMKSMWGDTPPTPPYVVRGFRLVGDGEEDFAVSLSFYVGRSLSSPEGNYLSHSYVIPRSLLEQHGYNLPWLAACLPCHFKYYPARGSGADALAPLTFNLDPARQFTLFRFVARELTEAGLHNLVGRLVAHAESDGSRHALDLDLPPPHANLGLIHHEVMGKPPQTAPGPDALRLLRLAGALAILPDAFKRHLTFTVNDNALAAGRTDSDAYAVRVARTQATEPPEPPETWPWFDHCVALAADKQLEELSELRAWLSRLLPGGRSPSRDALDVSFAFYQLWASLHQRPPDDALDVRALIGQIGKFRKCDVEVEALYDILLPLVGPQPLSYEDQCDLCVSLSDVVASAGKLDEPPPPRTFEAVKDCLKVAPERDKAVRLRFWHRLPEFIKLHLWESSYRERRPPGHVPMREDGVPDPYHLNFALTLFQPALLRRSVLIRRQIVQHLAECLLSPVAGAAGFYQGQKRSQLSRFLSGLDVLLNLTDGDSDLLRNLLDVLADEFCSVLKGKNRTEELKRVVRDALDHAPNLNMGTLAGLIRAIAIRDAGALPALLCSLSFEPEHRRRNRDFLRAVGGSVLDGGLQMLIGALQEMGEVLDRPDLLDADRALTQVLPRLYDLQANLEQSHDSGELLMDVQRALLPALRRLSAVERFNVGVAYLFVFAPRDDGLFHDLVNVLSENGAKIAAWCVSEDWKIPQGRGRSLARFLQVADFLGEKHLDRVYELAKRTWLSLKDPVDRRLLLLQLNHYLKRAKASRELQNAVQSHLERLSNRHGR